MSWVDAGRSCRTSGALRLPEHVSRTARRALLLSRLFHVAGFLLLADGCIISTLAVARLSLTLCAWGVLSLLAGVGAWELARLVLDRALGRLLAAQRSLLHAARRA